MLIDHQQIHIAMDALVEVLSQPGIDLSNISYSQDRSPRNVCSADPVGDWGLENFIDRNKVKDLLPPGYLFMSLGDDRDAQAVSTTRPSIYLLQALPEQITPSSLATRRMFCRPRPFARPMTATPLIGNTLFGLDISRLSSQLMSVRRRLSKRLLLLEFSASGLRYAEAAPSLDGICFSHISRVPLPEEALERGVPSDPTLMASLVQQLCQEKRIPAHRAAVVLPLEVAYQRIVELPSPLTPEEARLYLLDSANGAQLPFPLEQTDFDLYPLPRHEGSSSQSYLLIAVPQALIDRVISLWMLLGLNCRHLSSLHFV